MTHDNNPIERISKAEKTSKERIESSKKEARQELDALAATWQNKLNEVEQSHSAEFEKILAQTKKSVQELSQNNKNELEQGLKRLEDIDEGKITQAADLIFNKAIKK